MFFIEFSVNCEDGDGVFTGVDVNDNFFENDGVHDVIFENGGGEIFVSLNTLLCIKAVSH